MGEGFSISDRDLIIARFRHLVFFRRRTTPRTVSAFITAIPRPSKSGPQRRQECRHRSRRDGGNVCDGVFSGRETGHALQLADQHDRPRAIGDMPSQQLISDDA